MNKRTVPFVAALAVLPLFGLGCNPFASVQQSVEQTVTNSIVNQATGGKVSLNQNSNSVSFTDNKTGGTMSFGENVAIPSDFPKQAPIYPGSAAVSIVMSRTGDKSSSATLKTGDDVAKVLAWYVDQLKSYWKEESSYTANQTEIRSYTSDDGTLALTISPDEASKGSVITIVFTPKASGE